MTGYKDKVRKMAKRLSQMIGTEPPGEQIDADCELCGSGPVYRTEGVRFQVDYCKDCREEVVREKQWPNSENAGETSRL